MRLDQTGWHAVLAACITLCLAVPAAAQKYPVKPITVIIPAAPGGPSFEGMRIVGEKMSEALGQPLVLESRPGGGEVIGAVALKAAASDGYTIAQVAVGAMAINPALLKNMQYDPKEFRPITNKFFFPVVLAVPGTGAKTMAELVALSKSKPGGASYGGAAGGGATDRLWASMLRSASGLETTVIAYKGAAALVPDLIEGRIDMGMPAAFVVLPHLDSGKLRIIGIAGTRRMEARPEIPTLIEQGYAGVAADVWFGLAAPAGTPEAIIRLLHAEALKALNHPDVRKFATARGMGAIPSASPEEFAKFVASEQARIEKVAKEAGLYKSVDG